MSQELRVELTMNIISRDFYYMYREAWGLQNELDSSLVRKLFPTYEVLVLELSNIWRVLNNQELVDLVKLSRVEGFDKFVKVFAVLPDMMSCVVGAHICKGTILDF